MDTLLLKLYVTGRSPRSERAAASLRRLCETELSGACEVEVIDVLERPHLAETANILATPVLVRELPLPPRRVIGDLSDTRKVLLGLGLRPFAAAPEAE